MWVECVWKWMRIYSEAVWEICLIKCDFTSKIQPRKTDSGTEPVSVGIVWLKKTRKSYVYHIYHVSETSFYKIHQSERLPLAYRTSFDRTSSVSQYKTQTFHNRLKTTLTLDMSRNDVRLAVNHSAALKRFNQTTFVVLTKFAAPKILMQ